MIYQDGLNPHRLGDASGRIIKTEDQASIIKWPIDEFILMANENKYWLRVENR